MLTRPEHMTQSPDVQGVTIDFGDAPAHGRWRVMSMTITYSSGRRVVWRRYSKSDVCRRPISFRWFGDRRMDERIIHIRLNTWELLE